MSNILFPMNGGGGDRLCPICTNLHPQTSPCKYDNLVQVIHALRGNIRSLNLANREAVETAKAFQNIIKDLAPETERLVAIENEFRKLVTGLKTADVYPFAASTDPNKPAPLVGVSVDAINLILPPDLDDKPTFEKWLYERNKFEEFKKEDHACSTGDCDHDKQAQCDEALAKDFPDKQ